LDALVFILFAGFHHFEIAEFNLSLSLSFVFWGAFNLSLLNATIIIHELCIAVVPVRLVGGQYQILPLFFTY
jgi:hypothetical protein